jgi:hypothetical protein
MLYEALFDLYLWRTCRVGRVCSDFRSKLGKICQGLEFEQGFVEAETPSFKTAYLFWVLSRTSTDLPDLRFHEPRNSKIVDILTHRERRKILTARLSSSGTRCSSVLCPQSSLVKEPFKFVVVWAPDDFQWNTRPTTRSLQRIKDHWLTKTVDRVSRLTCSLITGNIHMTTTKIS